MFNEFRVQNHSFSLYLDILQTSRPTNCYNPHETSILVFLKGGDKLDLQNISMGSDYLEKVTKNIEHNQIILGFLNQKLEGACYRPKVKKRIDRIKDCNKYWVLDKYELAKIKDFKRTNLCGDKFCSNCKKVKQASRMARFMPHIAPYKQNLFQLVLTVPNVQGNALDGTIKEMYEAFPKLLNYLRGRKKIKGLNFDYLEYLGAVRSLEITYQGDSYHPHLHAVLVLKGQLGPKTYKNDFSIDHYHDRPDRLFCIEEIIIQKIWYLLTNATKVTKKNIDNLERGYSCMMDQGQEGDFQEIFKYMTKGQGEDRQGITFEQFNILDSVLLGVRQIQGYGCLFRIKDDEVMDNKVDEAYNEFIELLQDKERPLAVFQTPEALTKDIEYTVVSRKRIYKYLRDISSIT